MSNLTSLSLSVGRDCPQPSYEDVPNNTAMQTNCSHSLKALAGKLPVSYIGFLPLALFVALAHAICFSKKANNHLEMFPPY